MYVHVAIYSLMKTIFWLHVSRKTFLCRSQLRSKNQAAAKYDNEAQLTMYKLIPNYDYPTYLHLELHHSILESLGKIEAANQNPYTAIVSLCSR